MPSYNVEQKLTKIKYSIFFRIDMTIKLLCTHYQLNPAKLLPDSIISRKNYSVNLHVKETHDSILLHTMKLKHFINQKYVRQQC